MNYYNNRTTLLAVSGAPSKYLVGLLNFAGRTFSAIGTLMLVQVIVTFCRRRRGRCLRGASGTNADDMLAEQLNEGGGVSEAVGECFMGCVVSIDLINFLVFKILGLCLIKYQVDPVTLR